MKKLANDQSAISEIVGALMLILIVVIAASSLAVFVSQQQKILQDNQLIKDQKNGELLLISSLKTSTIDHVNWANLSITVSNMHQGSSEIDQISINNHVLRFFNVTTFSMATNSYVNTPLSFTSKWIIPSQQVVHLNVVMTDFVEKGVNLTVDGPIFLDLFTAYSNDFTKDFYPPTSIISINTESQWDSLANKFTAYLILDGSQSDQPGDGSIVKWSWTVEDSVGTNHTLDGRKVHFDPIVGVTGNYTITLQVQNVNGMVGTSTTTYRF